MSTYFQLPTTTGMADLKTLQADLDKIKEEIAKSRAHTTDLVEKRKFVEAAIKAAKAEAKAAAPNKAAKTSKAAEPKDDSADDAPEAVEPKVELPPVEGGGSGEPPKTPVKPTTPPEGAPKKKPADAGKKKGAAKGKKLELDE